MPSINVSAFTGETPLILPRLLGETAATEAFNARLDDGGLTPINKSQKTGIVVPHGTKTIFRNNGEWYFWNKIVNPAAAPVAAERVYFTGDGKPKVIINDEEMELAVQRPINGIIATVTGSGSGDTVTRTYVYTFVTDHGEETAPCQASPLVDWKPGQSVVLSGFELPIDGRDISKQRIYRSQTGSSGTYFYLIAERSVTADDFEDTVPVDEFQEAIPSIGWDEPPDTLTGLTSMPNGMMAAFSGKEVHFCEPWRPHAWPQKYMMLCDTQIVALASIGEVLVVLTKGQPYIMAGSHPDTMQSVKLETNHPCINARGVVDLGFCIAYPSNDGLIAIAADGSVQNLTQTLFRRHDWQELEPRTILGAQIYGAYALFYDVTKHDIRHAGCIFIYPGGTPFIIRSSEVANCSHYDIGDSSLYFLRANDTNIYQFDPKNGSPEHLYWRSKEWWLPRPMNFGILKVERARQRQASFAPTPTDEIEAINDQNRRIFEEEEFFSAINEQVLNAVPIHDDPLIDYPLVDNVQISVFGDGKLIASTSTMDRIVKLPAKELYEVYEISISSSVPISRVALSTSVDELRRLG